MERIAHNNTSGNAVNFNGFPVKFAPGDKPGGNGADNYNTENDGKSVGDFHIFTKFLFVGEISIFAKTFMEWKK